VRVEVRGLALFGGRNIERLRDTAAGARVVRISAWSIVGGVRVRVAG